jgi:hypothetical protein
MTGFIRRIAWGAAAVALLAAGSAAAQENLDSGKSAAQLYASDCAICHKTPQGLSKATGDFGLANFLREHYTASREAAAAIAAYVEANDHGGPPAERGAKRAGKPKEAAKPGETKSSKAKTEAKGSESAKPAEAKPAGAKPAEATSAEPKPVEAKAEAAKPAAKPPAESKPDSDKPQTEKKSD